ncbi:MAG: DeoR/GlpR family DNA-binding transcription regulator [Fusobacteriaceae bacterium]
MLAENRHKKILTILKNKTMIKVKELSEIFEVSFETIRRDLDFLEKKNYLKKVYGGAILLEEDISNLKFTEREKENIKEKNEIATLALKYIVEKDIISMNGGTTNLEIAKQLKYKFLTLTIITNSLSIANILSDDGNIKIILIGGILNHKENSLFGSISHDIIKKFNSTKSFLSVGGIDLASGITDFILEEVEIQKIMIENTKEVIIVADSSKFEKISLAKITDFNRINFIITDSNLDKEILHKYSKEKIKIVNNSSF